ncbi:hypothetical protein SCMU_00260 [Sinomonas cyclohexanicum]|uniref:Uncharacterized protein n=1 Tax=Sinomonas cyclohexanicum TaxID=322009 RepID=A0ABM7PPP4_SINCY|nr:hypothetical protein SCMU_00260 [Corynebacterium cyclohexanicum]
MPLPGTVHGLFLVAVEEERPQRRGYELRNEAGWGCYSSGGSFNWASLFTASGVGRPRSPSEGNPQSRGPDRTAQVEGGFSA